MRETDLDRYFDTVWCIAASPYVSEFIVGYTRRPSHKRRAEYERAAGYQYLVLLGDALSLSDALDLEAYLHKRVRESARSSVIYKKYHPEKRDRPSLRSAGGAVSLPETSNHAVYMAWREDAAQQVDEEPVTE